MGGGIKPKGAISAAAPPKKDGDTIGERRLIELKLESEEAMVEPDEDE